MQKILEFYKDVLQSQRYSVDDEGLISITTATGVPAPAEVEGKRLVLPTKQWLKQGFGDAYVGFHPLSETMARRGTSPVMQHMQRNARAQLGFTYVFLAQQLLRVAADRELHKELPVTDDCNDFLKKMQKADDQTVKLLDRLVLAASEKKRLITVYLKNGGTHQGKKVNRLAVIRFPLIELLEGDEPKVLGIEVKPKQRETILLLLRSILPNGGDPEEYSAGSNNRTAPYLHSFLQAYLKVIRQLNKIIGRYGKPMALPVKPFPVYDEELLGQFTEIYDAIPSLDGNEGSVAEVDDTEVVPTAPTKVKPITVQTQVSQTVAPTVQVAAPLRTAAKVVDDDCIDFETLKQQMMPQQNNNMMMQGYPNVGMMQQQPGPILMPWQGGPQMGGMQQNNNPYATVAASRTMQNQMPVSVPYGMGNNLPAAINPGMSYQVGMAANNLL